MCFSGIFGDQCFGFGVRGTAGISNHRVRIILVWFSFTEWHGVEKTRVLQESIIFFLTLTMPEGRNVLRNIQKRLIILAIVGPHSNRIFFLAPSCI